jgi:hypothetical protein
MGYLLFLPLRGVSIKEGPQEAGFPPLFSHLKETSYQFFNDKKPFNHHYYSVISYKIISAV